MQCVLYSNATGLSGYCYVTPRLHNRLIWVHMRRVEGFQFLTKTLRQLWHHVLFRYPSHFSFNHVSPCPLSLLSTRQLLDGYSIPFSSVGQRQEDGQINKSATWQLDIWEAGGSLQVLLRAPYKSKAEMLLLLRELGLHVHRQTVMDDVCVS